MADECQRCGQKGDHAPDCPIVRRHRRARKKDQDQLTVKVEVTLAQAKALLNSPTGVGISRGLVDQYAFDPAYCKLQDDIEKALAAACKHEWEDKRCKHCGARITYG